VTGPERCLHCGLTTDDPEASMCQVGGVSTGKLHDFRPVPVDEQRPGWWEGALVEPLPLYVRADDLAAYTTPRPASGRDTST
jgi:hypothetical protein